VVSLPVIPEDNSVEAVFPGAIAVYTWNATAKSYEMPTNIEIGKGYWVAVAEDTNITVSGEPMYDITMNLTAGWNMIGSVMCDVSIENLEDEPEGSVLSTVYWYDPVTRSYNAVEIIEPAKGYWVAATQNCTLTIRCM